MQIGTFLIVLLIVCSIIPSLIVATVLFLRQEAMRADIKTAVHQVELMEKDSKVIISQTGDSLSKLASCEADTQGVKLRMANLEESFVALSNKWNSRMRVEEQAERKKRKEDEERASANAGYDEIPGTEQQTIPFVDSRPVNILAKRKFGTMPR